MASCYNCNRKIGLFWMIRKTMVHTPWSSRRWIHRIIGLPFFYCPDCDAEIQPTALTMGIYLFIVVGGTFGTLWFMANYGFRNQIHLLSIAGIFLVFAALGALWWRFFGKTKEPFQFPWE